MDFIFGTLATEQLRILHHRLMLQGVQHAHYIDPLDPLPDEPVTLTVFIGQDMPVTHVACYYSLTDGDFICSRGRTTYGKVVMLEKVNQEFDTLTMAYTTYWQCQIPAQPDGTKIYYRISAWSEGGTEIFADYPELKATTERAAGAFFRGETIPELPPLGGTTGNLFKYHVDRLTVPKWAKDAIIYHIFVDRFYPGQGRPWLHPANLSGFFGGTLWGICDQLDYISELGANCIWLSPTFSSPTHHGYDITDYEHVEARMGGDDALKALVKAAHERGIRVLLDLVANHISDQHPYFQDALHNFASEYREWFIFDGSEIGYKTFFDVPSMPMINLNHAEARAWMLRIARYWISEFDIDGYRLDHANGPGEDFWGDFRAACREVKPDCFCFGEVVETPNTQRHYVGRLDGLLDFWTEDALRKTYGWGTMSEDQFKRFVSIHTAHFPDDFIMPTFLDNHDMDRFLYIVKGDKNALRRAVTAQMQLAAPPIIYYGTEVGLTQERGRPEGAGLEESRLPMLWGDAQDKDLLEFYKRIIKNRQAQTL